MAAVPTVTTDLVVDLVVPGGPPLPVTSQFSYSTFDPYTGGTVTYGPAGRPLPQLPLMVDGDGHLRAAGNFSARVGPSWLNVRESPKYE